MLGLRSKESSLRKVQRVSDDDLGKKAAEYRR